MFLYVHNSRVFLLHCALSLAARCIFIGPVCNGRALCVCGFVGLLPR